MFQKIVIEHVPELLNAITNALNAITQRKQYKFSKKQYKNQMNELRWNRYITTTEIIGGSITGICAVGIAIMNMKKTSAEIRHIDALTEQIREQQNQIRRLENQQQQQPNQQELLNQNQLIQIIQILLEHRAPAEEQARINTTATSQQGRNFAHISLEHGFFQPNHEQETHTGTTSGQQATRDINKQLHIN